jgi:hypothetical protein
MGIPILCASKCDILPYAKKQVTLQDFFMVITLEYLKGAPIFFSIWIYIKAHVVSSLAYPNLLGTKRLGCMAIYIKEKRSITPGGNEKKDRHQLYNRKQKLHTNCTTSNH